MSAEPLPPSSPLSPVAPAPWLDRAALAVMAVVAAAALLTFRDYGLGWDDFTHAQYGDLLLSLYGSSFRDTRALSFVNLFMYGGAFDMLAALVAKILPFDLFETRRLVGAAVGLVGLAVTWRLARRIGGPLAGLTAVIMLATCPLYYGHMFINAKDAPFAVAVMVLLFAVARVIDDAPQPSRNTTVLLGLGLGLAIGSRIMAGFAIISAAIAIGFLFVLQTGNARAAISPLLRYAIRLLPAAILGYAVMALIWPWSVADPLNPFRAVGYFAHFFEKPWDELFAGRLVPVPDMPRSYAPTLLGLQLPEVFIVLAFAGVMGAGLKIIRGGVPAADRAILLLLVLAAMLPLAVTITTRPAMYNGLRHFIFVLPPLAVLGGWITAELFRRIEPSGRRARAAAAGALMLGVLLPLAAMLRLHPYQYAYFNDASGGPQDARARYMMDYWGLSLKQASQALLDDLAARSEKQPDGRRWKVAVCGPHPPAQVALGDRFEMSWDPAGVDFVMALGEFYCAGIDAPQIARIERDNVIFARVYDVRGRTIKTLFTRPPVQRDS